MKPSLRTITLTIAFLNNNFFPAHKNDLVSQITIEFQAYCSSYEELPLVNQRRIPLNTGCQSVYSATYLEQKHPLEFQKVWKKKKKRIQVCFNTQETLEESFSMLPTVCGQLTVWT